MAWRLTADERARMLIAPPLAVVEPLPPLRKRFSLDEANRAVGYLERVVRDLVVAHREASRVRGLIEGARGDLLEALEADYRRLVGHVREFLRELDAVGVEVCDFEKGTVEFPAHPVAGVTRLVWAPGMAGVM